MYKEDIYKGAGELMEKDFNFAYLFFLSEFILAILLKAFFGFFVSPSSDV
ncbi:MAG: hypothetical protein JETT_3315 [Candidatus Jettenia ecosi]|uniref:Uncharacterized protein n=1 Tax=Candidatus Jettenia ecosi TaxID=2494326 RepID=A0A533Q8C3_9BACT|nr:MAG: hypothetical protein JETT_3315 [Candidatus Jettenia ecosi]